jgi:hypothetical protein
MAIVQISRITHRKGLMENLPQLAGGEFGWALDEQRLFIGNGTLADGAPVIGNTEILTQHSDILGLASEYNYKGEVENPNNSESKALPPVQTGVNVNEPIYRSLQAKLDDFVSVKDFGAVGNGVVDDTDAINRALYQLFCISVNEETRRSLYFPAGRYKVSSMIKVPPFAKIWGEGIESTVIIFDTEESVYDDYVMVTADTLQQIGANIGNNGAIPPEGIEVNSISVKSKVLNNILLIDRAKRSYFDSVNLEGSITDHADLLDPSADTKAIVIESSANFESEQVTFNKCHIKKTTFGLYSKYNCNGVTLSNSQLTDHYKGVIIGESGGSINGGPRGIRVTQNLFDRIAQEGIEISEASFNVSAFNLFKDVGNNFNGIENPDSPIVNLKADTNVSYGDLFQRNDIRNNEVQRIVLNNTQSIGFDNTTQLKLGQFHKTIGFETTVADGSITPQVIFELWNTDIRGFEMHYNMRRGDDVRTGKFISTVGFGTVDPTHTDEYTESTDLGAIITVSQDALGHIQLKVQTSATGDDVLVTYTLDKFAI